MKMIFALTIPLFALSLLVTSEACCQEQYVMEDGKFDTWISVGKGGGGDMLILPDQGNPPPCISATTHSGSSEYASLLMYSDDHFWNPSIGGTLLSVNFEIQVYSYDAWGQGQLIWPLLVQDNHNYVPNAWSTTGSAQEWVDLTGFPPYSDESFCLANDAFFEFGDPNQLITDTHPDFSSRGSPITFGFAVANHVSNDYTNWYDNWKMTLTYSTCPVPDAKINGSDGPLNVSCVNTVDFTITLDPSLSSGGPADWWVFVMKDSMVTYWWNYPNKWEESATSIRAAAATLRSVNDYSVYKGLLPVGTYTFTFAVDTQNNVYEGTYIDTCELTIF